MTDDTIRFSMYMHTTNEASFETFNCWCPRVARSSFIKTCC